MEEMVRKLRNKNFDEMNSLDIELCIRHRRYRARHSKEHLQKLYRVMINNTIVIFNENQIQNAIVAVHGIKHGLIGTKYEKANIVLVKSYNEIRNLIRDGYNIRVCVILFSQYSKSKLTILKSLKEVLNPSTKTVFYKTTTMNYAYNSIKRDYTKNIDHALNMYCEKEKMGDTIIHRTFYDKKKPMNIEYFKDNKDGICYHREDGPCIIEYYENGMKASEIWRLHGKLHCLSQPAVIRYYDDGKIKQFDWCINDVILKDNKLKLKSWPLTKDEQVEFKMLYC